MKTSPSKLNTGESACTRCAPQETFKRHLQGEIRGHQTVTQIHMKKLRTSVKVATLDNYKTVLMYFFVGNSFFSPYLV